MPRSISNISDLYQGNLEANGYELELLDCGELYNSIEQYVLQINRGNLEIFSAGVMEGNPPPKWL